MFFSSFLEHIDKIQMSIDWSPKMQKRIEFWHTLNEIDQFFYGFYGYFFCIELQNSWYKKNIWVCVCVFLIGPNDEITRNM